MTVNYSRLKKLVPPALLVFIGLSLGAVGTASAATVAPTVPANLRLVSATSTTLTMSWNASSSSAGIKYYTIYKNGVKIATTTNLSYTNTGLKSLTSYRYNVSATANDRRLTTSAQSANLMAQTEALPPSGLLATTISDTQVALAWTASPDNSRIAGYFVYRNGVQIAAVTTTASVATTTYTDTTVTASTAYTYTVRSWWGTSSFSAASNTISVTTPSPATPPIPVTTCVDIATPGNYVLANDLAATTGTTCVSIHDTTNVSFDCANHSVLSNLSQVLSIKNVTTFSLTNCYFSTQDSTPGDLVFGADIAGTSGGTMQNNTFTGQMLMQSSDNTKLTIKNNTFTNASYQQQRGTHIYFGFNTVNWANYSGAGLINMAYGSFNTIDTNILDGHGGWINNQTFYGMDDGILLQNEDSAVVSTNTMANFYDCGIETLGLITNSTIRDNTIGNATQCGIGGWYYNSWRSNTVTNNKVDNTYYMLKFSRVYGLQPGEQFVYFDNNTFTGNVLTNGTSPDTMSSWFDMYSSPDVPTSSIVAVNNRFTSNNFEKALMAPFLNPGSMIVDGGGNICGAFNGVSSGHLVCN